MENFYNVTGIIFGIVIGLLICFVAFRRINNDKNAITKYDERQKTKRGEGYKLGFWTVSIMCMIDGIIEMAGVNLPIEPFVLHFLAFIAGSVVICVYSVWNDAYWGLNNNKRRWLVFMVIIALINAGIAVMAIVEGEMITDGMLTTRFINAICALVFLVIPVTFWIKKLVKKEEEADEDEES